jgi:hypothetical protein
MRWFRWFRLSLETKYTHGVASGLAGRNAIGARCSITGYSHFRIFQGISLFQSANDFGL